MKKMLLIAIMIIANCMCMTNYEFKDYGSSTSNFCINVDNDNLLTISIQFDKEEDKLKKSNDQMELIERAIKFLKLEANKLKVQELEIKNKFNILSKLSNIASTIGDINIDEENYEQTILNDSKDLLNEDFAKVAKNYPDFKYCLGIIAYYCSGSDVCDEKLKNFFKEYSGKGAMTKDNGLALIKEANNENSYWFLNGLDEGLDSE